MGEGLLWRRGSGELLRDIAEVEGRLRVAYADSLELIAELAARDVAGEVGYSTLPLLLRDVLRIGVGEARRRVGHALAVVETPAVSGGVVPAALPVVAEALREGGLGGDHVEVIAGALRGLPVHVADVDREFAERTLVEAAREVDAGRLRRVGDRVRAWLDEDGRPPSDRELAEPVNELHLVTRVDGRTSFRGELDPESSALLATAVGALAKPRPTGIDGPDSRSMAERQGDALVELLHAAVDSGELPGAGGEKPHLLVTVPLQALRDGVGSALLDGLGTLDAASARRLACDAKVIPAVLGSRSEPLDLGRASYTVGTALRRALVLRDQGCAFPGCDRSHRWCHAHHVRHWAEGGTTELDNLVLLCGRHHRLIHHSEWECSIAHGRPEFRPPGFVDPARTPRRNDAELPPRTHVA